MNRRWLFSIIGIVILVGVVFFVRANLPTLIAVTPGDSETQVAIASPLKLTFSEEMQPESVLQNLEFQPPIVGSFDWDANTLTFTPAQPWTSGEQITVTLKAGARSTLGLPILGDQQWSFSTSPPLLVYLWPSIGPADLYAIDLVENIAIRLTGQPNGILTYDVSADGSQIYYSARLNSQNSAIFRLDRITGESIQILICNNVLCNYPQLSSGGDYLAYTRAPSNPGSEPFPQQVWLLPIVAGEPLAEKSGQHCE